MNYLPENTFNLLHTKPTQQDADAEGRVLYFNPKIGWYSGYWMWQLHTGTTHWTYCPPQPPIDKEDPKVKRGKAFEEWLGTLEMEIDDATKAWARLAFNAGWQKVAAGN